ncbi:MAG: ATP-binding cassette domain-containing protein [Candidatus Binatia bacterium]
MTISNLRLHAYGHALFGGRSISLKLCAGVVNVIVAANGAGKSVLLDVLAKRLRLKLGDSVIWHGIRSSRDVAYLPQQLFSVDDIFLGPFITLAFGGVHSLDPLLDRYRVWAKGGRRLRNLSGGQRQLLMFLAVRCQRQRVHFYDEPFRYLDDGSRSSVWHELDTLAQEGNLVAITNHESIDFSSHTRARVHVLD